MPNIELLKKKIDDSDLSMVKIADRSGIVRETLYNRLNGVGQFTCSEVVGLTKALNLSRAEREDIFFS